MDTTKAQPGELTCFYCGYGQKNIGEGFIVGTYMIKRAVSAKAYSSMGDSL